MSKDKTNLAKDIAEESWQKRRKLQFQIALDWKDGAYTGYEMIQKIVDLENVIYIDDHVKRTKKKNKRKPRKK